MNNRFIILIGSYNNEAWASFNLDSILTQTYKNFKIVYYNAASTDKTYHIAKTYADKDSRINLQTSPDRRLKTWFFENSIQIGEIQDNDIVCVLDGDDFLANEEVLNYLNEVYNQTNCWMTYGGMIVWNGEKTTEPFPQNSIPPKMVFDQKLYRQDLWRYSHMRTCRGFLWKKLTKEDFISKYDGNYMSMCDLCTVYPVLEMCPSDKIFRVEQSIYILNTSKDNGCRSYSELQRNNLGQIYEKEIRDRPVRKELEIITPTLAGGLGNQMFEIAAAASLAKDNNALLLVNPTEHILPNQGKNVNTYINNVFAKIAFDNKPPTTNMYNWESMAYKQIPYTPNVKLGGHYQSYKYFDHNRDYIRDLFWNKSVVYELDCHYHNTINTTAVHVRRGDYKKFPEHHPMLSKNYYEQLANNTDCDQIYVFSDDIDWCKTNLKFKVPVQYIKDEDYNELYLMASCRNIIISNSSFGWWAAYLHRMQDAKIFVPKNWYGPAILSKNEFNLKDLIPNNWNLI
jgi:glycosyltransferase involved in cell wall biosynthesis